MSSLRRSAAVSTASACIASRRSAIATSASSVGTTRVASCSLGRPPASSRGTSRVAIWRAVGVAQRQRGAAARRRRRDAELDRRRAQPERLRDPARGGRQRPVGVLAEQQLARQRRREVGLGAPALGLGARARASSAIVPATSATTMNAASATQLRLSAIVKRPTGGRWKKLNAAALEQRGERARAPGPSTSTTSSTAGR